MKRIELIQKGLELSTTPGEKSRFLALLATELEKDQGTPPTPVLALPPHIPAESSLEGDLTVKRRAKNLKQALPQYFRVSEFLQQVSGDHTVYGAISFSRWVNSRYDMGLEKTSSGVYQYQSKHLDILVKEFDEWADEYSSANGIQA